MSQPKSLTKSVWKSLQHCHDTRIDPHACEHSKFPIVLEHDEEQGTASHCVTDVNGVASSRLAFGSKIIRCIDKPEASVTEFYKRVLWHEYGHAIETVNMFALVGGGDYEAGRASAMTDLANHGIPFRLFIFSKMFGWKDCNAAATTACLVLTGRNGKSLSSPSRPRETFSQPRFSTT